MATAPGIAGADENGLTFWLPGLFASMAATPQQPGWSLASIYYHANVSASGNVGVSRAITIGQFNPSLNVSLNANVKGQGDLGVLFPTYVFATSFFGGQAALGMGGIYGRNNAALNATIGGTLAGIPLPTRSVALEQSDMAFGDLIRNFRYAGMPASTIT